MTASSSSPPADRHALAWPVLLVAICLGLFLQVQAFRAYFPVPVLEIDQVGTPINLLRTKNWFINGPGKMAFAVLENPVSVELRDEVRGSDPPGYLLPLYLAGLGKGVDRHSLENLNIQLSVSIVQYAHFFTALFFSLAAFFFARSFARAPSPLALLAGLCPLLIYFGTPGAIYLLGVEYTAQSISPAAYALLFLLEVRRDIALVHGNAGGRRLVDLAMAIVAFFACIMSWNGVTWLGAIVLKRLCFDGDLEPLPIRIKGIALLGCLPLAGFALYLLQVHSLVGLDWIFSKLTARSSGTLRGGDQSLSGYVSLMAVCTNQWLGPHGWSFFLSSALAVGVMLVLAARSLLRRITGRDDTARQAFSLPARAAGYAAILIVSPCLVLTVLRQWASYHGIYSIELLPLLALVLGILFPIFLFGLCEAPVRARYPQKAAGVLAALLLAGTGAVLTFTAMPPNAFVNVYFRQQSNDRGDLLLGKFIGKNTTSLDVLISPWLATHRHDHIISAEAMKYVHYVEDRQDIEELLRRANGFQNLKILDFEGADAKATPMIVTALIDKAQSRTRHPLSPGDKVDLLASLTRNHHRWPARRPDKKQPPTSLDAAHFKGDAMVIYTVDAATVLSVLGK